MFKEELASILLLTGASVGKDLIEPLIINIEIIVNGEYYKII